MPVLWLQVSSRRVNTCARARKELLLFPIILQDILPQQATVVCKQQWSSPFIRWRVAAHQNYVLSCNQLEERTTVVGRIGFPSTM